MYLTPTISTMAPYSQYHTQSRTRLVNILVTKLLNLLRGSIKVSQVIISQKNKGFPAQISEDNCRPYYDYNAPDLYVSLKPHTHTSKVQKRKIWSDCLVGRLSNTITLEFQQLTNVIVSQKHFHTHTLPFTHSNMILLLILILL